MSETVAAPVASVEQIGNIIVGGSLVVMGGMLTAGAFGVAFLGELAAIALLITGFLMTLGRFGANATVGTLMMIFGPAAIIVPPFLPAFAWLAPLLGAAILVMGITKLPGMWD